MEFQVLANKLDGLVKTVDNINEKIGELSARVANCELSVDTKVTNAIQNSEVSSRQNVDIEQEAHSHSRVQAEPCPIAPGQQNVPADADAVFDQYDMIRDSVSRTKLNPCWTFKRERSGIKREDQKHFNTICKCATIAETQMKLLCSVSTETVTNQQLDDLFVTAYAQNLYLREELANLYIKADYGDNTARMYKSLQKGQIFCPQKVEVLKSAVQLASMQQQPNQQGQGRGFQRQFNNRRRNGGDNYRRENGRKDYYQSYSGYTNRQMPPRRANQENDQATSESAP